MGIIRKTLMISTAGVVRGSSKKQRVARAQLGELRAQTRLLADELRPVPTPPAERVRMEPMSVWRTARAAIDRSTGVDQVRPERQPRPLAVTPPPAGWFPDADRPHLLRWWDGTSWTARTAPRA